MLFSDLGKIVSGNSHIYQDLKINRFSTDTRTLLGSPNEVFIALQGKRDGHSFIEDALAKGVKNFIAERQINDEEANFLTVESSIEAFQKIAKHHRNQFNIPVIGITGSNGKTTVKEWLSTLLSEQYFVVKNPKSYNSQIGVPLSVMEIQDIHEVGVFEAGISLPGEMPNLEEIIKPTLGIFTTLGNAHADGFENDEKKLMEKLKLFHKCDKLIYRKDTTYAQVIEKEIGSKIISWAREGNADYLVKWENGIIHVNDLSYQTNFSSDTDLENATHAIIAAMELGVENQLIQNGLELIRPIPMRLELKKGINGCFLLDDTYNNDLHGLRVALDYLDTHKQNRKKTLILSDILQSGMSDEELYTQVNELLVDRKLERLVGVGSRILAKRKLFSMESTFYDSVEMMLESLPEFDQEMIILKGARHFALERVVKLLEQQTHGTILEVNFEALQHNLNQYRNLVSRETKMMVMVKANAYGSGILEVANFLQHQRVDRLGVAYVDEAIHLRKHGIHIPIMIMNPDVDSFHDFKKYKLEAEIFSLNHFRQFLSSSKDHVPIHLKIDTGMHRLGFSEEDIPELINVLKVNPKLEVAGIFTHFAGSENPEFDAFTKTQVEVFERIYDQITGILEYKPLKHACNSSGIVRWPKYHYDMVRLGIGLHGFDPTSQISLRPTSQLKSIISQIRSLHKGDTVGYSRNGKIRRESKIAILPLGYEDGFLRAFGNGKTSVLIDGKLCPTIGNVCMDMLMVDVTDVNAREGDEAIIFGNNPTIEELAEQAGTIPYEILTSIGSRVKRVFVWE